MASKTLTKSLLVCSRFLLRRLLHRRNAHGVHVKLHKYPPPPEKLSDIKTLVFELEGGLLRSSSTFPYFMLVALEAGGFLRGLLLLLLYPLICFLSKEVGIRVMAMVTFCGIRKERFRVGRAMLPKFLLEGVGLEAFEVMRKGRRRVCVSSMPRVMVEVFLEEYLEVEVVVGRELKVVGGYYTGFMEEDDEERLELEVEKEVGGSGLGFASYSKSLHHHLFSQCKEVYIVTQGEKRSWHPLPPSDYPKPLVFHDGRIAFLPSPLPSLAMLLWLPIALPLSVLRVLLFALLPYSLAVPIGSFTGLHARFISPPSTSPQPSPTGPHQHHLYVCNHRTLLDPVYISTAISNHVTAVTYSVSPMSELLSPIPTVRLTRNKEEDRRRMAKQLKKGDIVVCPEGTTCREPYLLRFSPLFAELADEIVPVALATRVCMFHGTTAGGFKWMDPFFFLMNPKPEYELKFLERMETKGEECNSWEVANKVQSEIGRVLGYECTSLTRKDKYLMLAGNKG